MDYGALRNPLFLRLPPITGLRALPREIFAAVPEAKRKGFQIEIMINEVIARGGMPSAIRVLAGIRHRSKIAKQGWRRGLPSHLRDDGRAACMSAGRSVVDLWGLPAEPAAAAAGGRGGPAGRCRSGRRNHPSPGRSVDKDMNMKTATLALTLFGLLLAALPASAAAPRLQGSGGSCSPSTTTPPRG